MPSARDILNFRPRGPWHPLVTCPACRRQRPFSEPTCGCGQESPRPDPVAVQAAPAVGAPAGGEPVTFTLHRKPGTRWGRLVRKGRVGVTEEGVHLWARRQDPLAYLVLAFLGDFLMPWKGEVLPYYQVTEVILDPSQRLVVVATAEVSHGFRPGRDRFWPMASQLRQRLGARVRTGRVGSSREQVAHTVYDGVVLAFLFLPFLAVGLVMALLR